MRTQYEENSRIKMVNFKIANKQKQNELSFK